MTGLVWRRRALLACALVAVLALPAPALARKTVIIRGRGWGHGIGMSQYGALGRALAGKGARKILTHYYSRARVRKAKMPARVRVGLLQGRGKVRVRSRARRPGGGRIVFKLQRSRRRIAAGGTSARWRLEPSATGGVRLYKNGRRVKRRGRTVFGGPNRGLKVLFSGKGSLAHLKQKRLSYAYGRLHISTHTQASCGSAYCLRVVLALPMQKYVYGLGEVPASWPQAVLRAQAIAARTYALRRIRALGQRREPCDCALYDSALDQVYSGDAKRTGSGQYWDDWKRAVDATRAKVVVYRGAPIQALYSSSSGGHTENVENVWGGTRIPYLRGVRDGADAVSSNPNHRWRLRLPWSTFARRLRATFRVGRVRRVKLVRPFGVSGRVTVVKSRSRGGVRIVGSAGRRRVSGWAMRSALGLKDTWFRLRIRYRVLAQVEGAYDATGGASGPLGRATSGRIEAEAPASGWSQRFRHGAIYALPGREPVALWGAIADRYRRIGEGASRCGLPLEPPSQRGDELRAAFEHGVIVSSPEAGTKVTCGRDSVEGADEGASDRGA